MFRLGSKVSLDTGIAKKNDLVVVIAGMQILQDNWQLILNMVTG